MIQDTSSMLINNDNAADQHEICSPISECPTKMTTEPVKPAGMTSFDVICGRCSLAFNNVGNRRFRVIIGMHVQRYIDAPTRPAKGTVIQSVVELFKEQLGARFVKQSKSGEFVPVSLKIVRQKVGHALRDLAAQRTDTTTTTTSSTSGDIKVEKEKMLPKSARRRTMSLKVIQSSKVSPLSFPARAVTIGGDVSSSDDTVVTDKSDDSVSIVLSGQMCNPNQDPYDSESHLQPHRLSAASNMSCLIDDVHNVMEVLGCSETFHPTPDLKTSSSSSQLPTNTIPETMEGKIKDDADILNHFDAIDALIEETLWDTAFTGQDLTPVSHLATCSY